MNNTRINSHVSRHRLGALLAALLSAASAQATDVTYTTSSTGTINWSAIVWNVTAPDWTTTAGDSVRFNGTAATSATLDTNITVGGLRYNGSSGLTILSNGTNIVTLDANGLAAATNPFGNAGTAFIGQVNGNASTARVFTIGSSTTGMTVNTLSDLDIGNNGTTGSALNMFGTIDNTSGTAKTLTIRANTTVTGTGSRGNINISSAIGSAGSSINVVNAGTGGTAGVHGIVTLSGILGANVAGISQTSATSSFIISSTANASAFVGNTSVTAGKLSIGTNYTMAGGTDNHLSVTGMAAPVAGTNYGQVLVTANTTTFGGALTLDFTGTVVDGTVYDLFSTSGTGALAGDFASVSIAGSYLASLINNSGVWTGSNGGFDFSFSQATGDLTISASAIPEPSAFAALIGAAGLGTAALRRRRRA